MRGSSECICHGGIDARMLEQRIVLEGNVNRARFRNFSIALHVAAQNIATERLDIKKMHGSIRPGLRLQPLPVLRHTPITPTPGVVAVTHCVERNLAIAKAQYAADLAGLLEAVVGQPLRTAVGMRAVVVRGMRCFEVVLQAYPIAGIGKVRRLQCRTMRDAHLADAPVVEALFVWNGNAVDRFKNWHGTRSRAKDA